MNDLTEPAAPAQPAPPLPLVKAAYGRPEAAASYAPKADEETYYSDADVTDQIQASTARPSELQLAPANRPSAKAMPVTKKPEVALPERSASVASGHPRPPPGHGPRGPPNKVLVRKHPSSDSEADYQACGKV